MKVAISVPDPVFNAAERLAKQRKVARSQLVTDALQEYIAKHGASAITSQLDEIYAVEDSSLDDSLVSAQLNTLNHETW